MAKVLRVHSLAKELGVTSKQIIDKCNAEGVELKNHMAAVSVGLAASIREWFSAGDDITTIEVAEKIDLAKVRPVTRKRERHEPSEVEPAGVATTTVVEEEAPPQIAAAPAEIEPAVAPQAPEVAEVVPPSFVAPAPVEVAPAVAVPVSAPAETPEASPPVAEPEIMRPAAEAPSVVQVEPAAPLLEPPPPPKPILPAGPKLVPAPAELRGPRVVRIEAPEPVRPLRSRPAAQGPLPPATVGGAEPTTGTGSARRGRGRARTKEEDTEAAKLRSRSPRRRGVDVKERIQEWRDQDLLERKERLAGVTGHGLKDRRTAEQRRQAVAAATSAPAARKAPVEIAAPLTLKEFCSAVGVPFTVVSKKLVEHTSQLWRINQSLDAETAELIAMDLGLTVSIAKQKTALERLQEETERREREHLLPRPPVVAMLGHVDHGKTSLLDAIRKTDVAAGEAGGITQHIGASRIDRGDWHVTFIDTPGHEAFTAMRARGANLTDVVVLVVAADDGVMPQTVEAINHARAARVAIVVALNKIDLPGVDINRIYAQLSEQGLTPAEWGGETDVIKTSATTGVGIDDLLAHLSTLSELMDLKADPSVPATATVIEARMQEGRGVSAQVLVREGTLEPGQFVVCGPAAGRIRALRDHLARQVEAATPGTPVEISGLDELPSAGDALYQVDSLSEAKEIAEEVREQRRTVALGVTAKPRTLEALMRVESESGLPELNVIVKSDAQGSVEVLKKALGELPSSKAQLRVLHAAVGAITESDVNLAKAQGAMIIGFHVVPEDRGRTLAEQLGVEVRLYRVIYEILDDMRKALAGLLEPIRREEVRGTTEVRQVFNITRVGVVAGCYVTNGVVVRSHKARVIRDGRVVVEGRSLHSLKRFKDDAREVRAGLECGIKLEGYDDIKPGDVVETYEVIKELQIL